MRLKLDIDPDILAMMAAEVAAGERAVTAAMREAGTGLKTAWRMQINGAGLGRRLANSIRNQNFPRSGESLDAAALVWSKAPVIVGAHDTGPLIRSKDGFWLAIPLPAAGKSTRGGRITPGEWERRRGLRLRFVYRRTGPSLLVAEGRLNTKGQAVVSRSKTGRGKVTAPIFLLVPQVKLPKRLDLARDAARAHEAVPGLIVAGEIDLSVASIIALASTAMGWALQFDAGVVTLVIVGLTTGLLCGAFNGFLVTGLGLPSIVVTIGTMSLFRGISYIILSDQGFRGYPPEFSFFGQGYVYWVISFEFVLFAVLAVIYYVLLHRTNFGRTVYAIGNNPTAALFSGIRVARVKFILFLLTGLMSGVAAICLTARLGSTRPTIALGWELEIVTMVVLGGINILGGSGTIQGVVIAAFIMGLVTFGLGLLNVPGIVMSIFIGCLLIGVIALPRLWAMWRT